MDDGQSAEHPGGRSDVGTEPVDNPVSTGSASPDALAGFECPRCGAGVAEPYYGPCSQCREQLRATVSATPRAAGDSLYEPKMNVTPNAVALKE